MKGGAEWYDPCGVPGQDIQHKGPAAEDIWEMSMYVYVRSTVDVGALNTPTVILILHEPESWIA